MMESISSEFYSFFRNKSYPFEDVVGVLKEIGLHTATLSDVAYGMDNKFALEDLKDIKEYIDLPLTSNDVGFRKPNTKGLEIVAAEFNSEISKIVFVGDEKKDVQCANNAGAVSVLIDRNSSFLNFGQKYTIFSMKELLNIIY